MFDRFDNIFHKLLGFGNNSKKTSKRRRPTTRQLRFENLERREMMTATPAAPVFEAQAYSSSQVNLSWNAVPGATDYLVKEYANGAWKQVGNFLYSSVHTYQATGLSAGTTYWFEVAAYNSAGATWAAEKFATTGISVDHPAAAAIYTNVSGPLFGANGPQYTDVKQGTADDCWLLASLAEVAARNPADIYSMFTAAGTTVENGTTVNVYHVRLYNNAGNPVSITVDTELPAEGEMYDQAATGPLWVALAEKAYAQANGKGYVTTNASYTGIPDSYASLNYGDPSWALHAITGKTSNSNSINPTNIASAWNAGQLIVLCSDLTPPNADIVGNHCYAMIGYSAQTGYTFYNPWGMDSANDGWSRLVTLTGQKVYGEFNCGTGFISQNFALQGIGSATAQGTDSPGNGMQNLLSAGNGHVQFISAVYYLTPEQQREWKLWLSTQDIDGAIPVRGDSANAAHTNSCRPSDLGRPSFERHESTSTAARDLVFAAWGDDAKPANMHSNSALDRHLIYV